MAMVARVAKFYRPDEEELTTANNLEPVKAMEIRRLHEYYNHPSVTEMKRMSGKWFGGLEVTPQKGKLKEHARRASTKPLTATRPGENGVADLMFIEGRNGVKTPFYIDYRLRYERHYRLR